ncbi:hypothetical protein SB724_20980, partial [Bacillus sp. SIMBA_031]
ATFLGSPAMNLLNGRLERRDGSLYFCTPHWRLDVSPYLFKSVPADQLPCVLGVRAEDVRPGDMRVGDVRAGAGSNVSVSESAKV